MAVVPNVQQAMFYDWCNLPIQPTMHVEFLTLGGPITVGPSDIISIDFSLELYPAKYLYAGAPANGDISISFYDNDGLFDPNNASNILLPNTYFNLYLGNLCMPELTRKEGTSSPSIPSALNSMLGSNIYSSSSVYALDDVTPQVTKVICTEELAKDSVYLIKGYQTENNKRVYFYDFIRTNRIATNEFYLYNNSGNATSVVTIDTVRIVNYYKQLGTWFTGSWEYDTISKIATLHGYSENNNLAEYARTSPSKSTIWAIQDNLTPVSLSISTAITNLFSNVGTVYTAKVLHTVGIDIPTIYNGITAYTVDFIEVLSTLCFYEIFINQYGNLVVGRSIYGNDFSDDVTTVTTEARSKQARLNTEAFIEFSIDQAVAKKYANIALTWVEPSNTAVYSSTYTSDIPLEEAIVSSTVPFGVYFKKDVSEEFAYNCMNNSSFDIYNDLFVNLSSISFTVTNDYSVSAADTSQVFGDTWGLYQYSIPEVNNTGAQEDTYYIPNAMFCVNALPEPDVSRVVQIYEDVLHNDAPFITFKIAANPYIWIGTRLYIDNDIYNVHNFYKVYRVQCSYSGAAYMTVYAQICID